MKISDVMCQECGAAYERAETDKPLVEAQSNDVHCEVCGATLETLSSDHFVVLRLTAQPDVSHSVQ